jgi:thymidylate synthase
MNPGTEWENWPYNKSASTFLEKGKFNHNYMERYWPKYAGQGPVAKTPEQFDLPFIMQEPSGANHGIYHPYGDLADLVKQLAHEPDTRQAYLPVWFPEDTGVVHKSRVPCSLGYHFIMRGGFLHCNYYLRSCDFVRHFRDDIYLTVRLQIWIIEQCRLLNPEVWNDIKPGLYTMHITSLHIFKADWQPLFGDSKSDKV